VRIALLPDRMPALWADATRHEFLTAVGGAAEGSAAAFARWLAQDVVFVRDLIDFQARLLGRAPRPAQRVLAEGIVGLFAELDWFAEQADALGVDFDAEPESVTLDYRRFLQRLDREPYPVAIAALWTLERVYLDAWRHAGAAGSGGSFAAAIEHWTDPDFAEYVSRLEEAADASLTDVAEQQVLDVVRAVLDLECAFWEMAWPSRWSGVEAAGR
jgi:formylaminopyrimidine deformylase / aminopyrimidine aminohydrolase